MRLRTRDLIRTHRHAWNLMVRNPFVLAVRDGTLPEELFDHWLVQARYRLEGLVSPVARLLAAAPPPDRPVLLAALGGMLAELDWYAERIARKGLDPLAPVDPLVLAQNSRTTALGYEPYVVGLVSYWTQHRSYAEAWAMKGRPSGLYRDVLEHWSRPRLTEWSRLLQRSADRALAAASPRDCAKAEAAFRRVLEERLAFWTMTLE